MLQKTVILLTKTVYMNEHAEVIIILPSRPVTFLPYFIRIDEILRIE